MAKIVADVCNILNEDLVSIDGADGRNYWDTSDLRLDPNSNQRILLPNKITDALLHNDKSVVITLMPSLLNNSDFVMKIEYMKVHYDDTKGRLKFDPVKPDTIKQSTGNDTIDHNAYEVYEKFKKIDRSMQQSKTDISDVIEIIKNQIDTLERCVNVMQKQQGLTTDND